jgi:choline dehydrogenase-like flavoprotein
MDHVGGGGASGTNADAQHKSIRAGRARQRHLRSALRQLRQTERQIPARLRLSRRLRSIALRPRQIHSRIRQILQSKVREDHPWGISLGGFGESLARFENQVSINKDVVDAWGIPVAHIECEFGDNERLMVEDMGETGCRDARSRRSEERQASYGPTSIPGILIHEVGTARMGNDRRSLCLKIQSAHDVKNLS